MEFNILLTHNVFKAMESNENDKNFLNTVAMESREIKKHTNVNNLSYINKNKNYLLSVSCRDNGDEACEVGFFQKALIFYNQALAYAPNISLCLKQAFNNRSALLFSAKQYAACEKDCETALAINCSTPNHLTKQLMKRKAEAHKLQKLDLAHEREKVKKFADDYFKLKSKNDTIPCASADIDIVFESGMPTVIAKRDIPAGTLVAFEKAFITWICDDPNEQYFSCYYCCKLDLNLFPCEGCVTALFCSKLCEEKCKAEYHNVECQILGNISLEPKEKWMVKAIIKLRNMCPSWEELETMSYKYGYGKKDEIYDSNKPSSLLSFGKDRNFLYGALFNSSFVCAEILNVLQNMNFLPQESEKKLSAMNAVARILMYWNLYSSFTILSLAAHNVCSNSIHDLIVFVHGLFSFASKLKYSCVPNLQTVGVNDSVALFASELIKSGTELTITHGNHWLDNTMSRNENKRFLFLNCRMVCTCIVCTNDPRELIKHVKSSDLSATQKKAIQECISLSQCNILNIPINKCIERLFKALTCLSNVKFSKEYKNVHVMLRNFHMYILGLSLQNNILSEYY